jgi:uncharacterized protein (TIGR00730 family)
MSATLLAGNQPSHSSQLSHGAGLIVTFRSQPRDELVRPVACRSSSADADVEQPRHDGEMAAICVFCGSSSGNDPIFVDAARTLGTEIATTGHELVFGGGHVGLMGVVADAALAAGGTVIGVMTEQLVGAEVAHTGLTRLEVVASMHARKARMADLSDGVIVLPGGFGTLDETFEIMTWNQLGLVSVPVVFLDVSAYFDELFGFIDSSVRAGFVSERHARSARRALTVADAIVAATRPGDEFSPKWIG